MNASRMHAIHFCSFALVCASGASCHISDARRESTSEHGQRMESSAHGESEGEDSEEAADEEGESTKIAFDQLPSAVRASFAGVANGATPGNSERSEHRGVTTFEVEFTQAGVASSARFSDSGAVLELERSIAPSSLPASVRSVLEKRFPGSTIEETEVLELHYYECVMKSGGKSHEVRISPSGVIEDIE